MLGETCVSDGECQSGCCDKNGELGVCTSFGSCHFTVNLLAFILPAVFIVYGVFLIIAGLRFRKRVKSSGFRPPMREPFRDSGTTEGEGIELHGKTHDASMVESEFSREVLAITSPSRTILELMSEEESAKKSAEKKSRIE